MSDLERQLYHIIKTQAEGDISDGNPREEVSTIDN